MLLSFILLSISLFLHREMENPNSFAASSFAAMKKKMSGAESQASAFLPEEIVFNILSRLPVKSICRFKCVCKTWLSIISAPAFVDSHSDRSKSQPKLLVTISGGRFNGRKEGCRYLFIADQAPEQDNGSSLVLKQSVTMPTKQYLSPFEVSTGDSQSVGGLMFSVCSQELIRIANPSTNKCIAFAQPNYSPLRHEKAYRYVSLGFDPVQGKHKFLESRSIYGSRDVVWRKKHRLFTVADDARRAEHRVFTVGDDAKWRTVKDDPSIYRDDQGELFGQEICVNGVIYFTAWTCREIGGWEQCMAAFDVRSESFQTVKFSIEGRFNHSSYAGNPCMYVEFDGKVAIVDYPLSNREDRKNTLELWVLEDFQDQVWSLKFAGLPSLSMEIYDPFYGPKYKLVGSTLDGQLIFAVFGRGNDFTESDDSKMIPNVTDEKGVSPLSFHFFDMKTGDFRSSKVCLPEGFAFTGEERITAVGHVEKLLSI